MGRAEIGAAWSKPSREGRDYLSVKLDDPSFNAPIYANLFDDEDGRLHPHLVSRPPAERRLSRTSPTPRPVLRAERSGSTILRIAPEVRILSIQFSEKLVADLIDGAEVREHLRMEDDGLSILKQ